MVAVCCGGAYEREGEAFIGEGECHIRVFGVLMGGFGWAVDVDVGLLGFVIAC
jgi:hypothetical protein